MTQESIEHINYAIPAKAHTQMYLMHKWWARKPHNVVSEYIEHYSKKGDIVLDPFCGSGVTAIESIKLGRKAIAIDLDPIATFITRMTATPADVDEIKKTFEEIKKRVRKQIVKLYLTRCKKCKNVAQVICSIWKTKTKQPLEIRYYCPHCKERIHKRPDKTDLKKLSIINKTKVPYWYPDPKLRYGNGKPFMKKEKSETLSDLFTQRNLIALSILYNAIEKIKNKDIRDLFKFRFTSISHLASKMTPDRPTRPYSSFWALHSYWVPPKFMESNVWLLFRSSIMGRQGLVVGKEDTNKQINYYKEAKKFDDFKKDANILINTQSALDLSNIPKNSIDYVFTDPPYGGSVQYFELSFLWCSWLNHGDLKSQFSLNFDEEITINNQQNKDFDYYHKMLRRSFEEIYNVLKSDKYLTVTFHNTNIKIFNSILKAVVLAGFDFEKVIYQPPARASAKMLLQPYGSAEGDYYIRFKKPLSARADLIDAEIDKTRYEKIIVECVKKVIAERGEPTPYTLIINSYPLIYDELKKSGYLLSTPESIQDVLKKNLDKEFVLVPVKDEKGKTIGSKWWFKDSTTIPYLDRVPLVERVERTVVTILNKKMKTSFDDIIRALFENFPNSLTPDTQSIRSILALYAEKTKDGKWMLKTSVKQREGQHDVIVETLCKLGEMAGYSVYGDTSTRRTQLSFDIPEQNLQRVQEIDVLWYKDGKIYHEFEVENTTGITEGIIRGYNIPYDVKRFIVIPNERENLLVRKIEEPALKEHIITDKWGFIHYDDLLEFYSNHKRSNKINVNDFEGLSRMPKSVRDGRMDEFA